MLVGVSHAQADYPNRAVRIIVPFPVGQTADLIARMLAQKLTDALGQNFWVEDKPGAGGIIARGAGTYAQLNARDGKYAIIKMPSGETRMILTTCLATIGSVSNSEHNLVVSGKAGRSRWLGRRPRVRGVVMNPVDHPMGGGEGRNSGGHPRSRNGMPAKGFKTRSKSKYSDKFIVERRKK